MAMHFSLPWWDQGLLNVARQQESRVHYLSPGISWKPGHVGDIQLSVASPEALSG